MTVNIILEPSKLPSFLGCTSIRNYSLMNMPEVWKDFSFCFPGRNSWLYEFSGDQTGVLGCISVRLDNAQKMVILACITGLVLCCAQWWVHSLHGPLPCSGLGWLELHPTGDRPAFLFEDEPLRWAFHLWCMLQPLLLNSSNPSRCPCRWLSQQKTFVLSCFLSQFFSFFFWIRLVSWWLRSLNQITVRGTNTTSSAKAEAYRVQGWSYKNSSSVDLFC